MKALLTSSRMSAARACQRLHHFKYELGYRPAVEAEALTFGTLIHKGLEAWWRAPQATRLESALLAMAEGQADPFEHVKAQEMLRGYHFRWGDEAFETLAVEAEFAMPLRNPATGRPSSSWMLGGKIDAILRDTRTGRVLICEHKTASGDIGAGSEYFRRLKMDAQISIYYDGAASLGHDISGCLYDVLGKPGIRPLKATPPEQRKFKKDGELYAGQRLVDETPEEYRVRLVASIAENPSGYYQRGEVVRLESELDEARFDVWQIAQQIHAAKAANQAPRNPDACSRWGRTCEFFAACCGEASLEDPSLFKKIENVHPELTGEVAAQSKEETAS